MRRWPVVMDRIPEEREMDLQEQMTAGVLVEFLTDEEQVVGQTALAGWRGRPLPAVGDTVVCSARGPNGQPGRRLRGRVVARYFDLQQDDHGCPVVWARLEVRVDTPRPRYPRRPGGPIGFSAN